MKFADILVKSRVLDPDYTVSTTSLLMFVIIVKIALMPSLDLPTITALFVTLTHANMKKLNIFRTKQAQGKRDAEVEGLKAQIAAQEKKDREAFEQLTRQVQELNRASNFAKLGK